MSPRTFLSPIPPETTAAARTPANAAAIEPAIAGAIPPAISPAIEPAERSAAGAGAFRTGCRYTLTPSADLAVFYAADAVRYRPAPGQPESPILKAVSRRAFMAFYAGRPSRGFAHDGKPIGGLLFDGIQAHIAVLPEHHGRWAALWRPALDWLFSLKPILYIDIENDNHRALAFMARNGWPAVPMRQAAHGGIARDITVFRMSAPAAARPGSRQGSKSVR